MVKYVRQWQSAPDIYLLREHGQWDVLYHLQLGSWVATDDSDEIIRMATVFPDITLEVLDNGSA